MEGLLKRQNSFNVTKVICRQSRLTYFLFLIFHFLFLFYFFFRGEGGWWDGRDGRRICIFCLLGFLLLWLGCYLSPRPRWGKRTTLWSLGQVTTQYIPRAIGYTRKKPNRWQGKLRTWNFKGYGKKNMLKFQGSVKRSGISRGVENPWVLVFLTVEFPPLPPPAHCI